MIIIETKAVQKLFWCEFSKFLKRNHLKGKGHRIEERIPGSTIGIRYSIYGNKNNQNHYRRNCICVTLFTSDANAVEGLFETIKESLQGIGISFIKESENTNDNTGLRIIVINTQINVYESEVSDWETAYEWMYETILKLIKILIKRVTFLNNESLKFLNNY